MATVLGFAAQGRDASELPRFYLKNGGAYVSRCAIRFEGTDQQYRSDVGTGWHHVVWTVREISWTLYVNGSPVSGNKTGKETANENGTLWLGALPGDHGPTEPFIGAIDDFRVYRTSLPAREVRLLSRRK